MAKKAKPTRAKLDTVETKAQRGAKPVKSTQTRAQVKKVIAEGNYVKERTVGGDLGIDRDGVKQRTAAEQAAFDARGTDLQEMTDRKAVRKTLKSLDKARNANKPASQRKSRAAADLVDYRPMGKNAETAMINRQRQFEKLPAGHPKKEQLRRSIGRTLQTGILSESGGAELKQIACQGEAGCGNSVKVLNSLDLTPAGKGRALDPTEGDVVCRDCLRKGDVAGKTYRDRAEQMSSTNTGAGRVGTAETRRAS
jgi:hypothetical protein